MATILASHPRLVEATSSVPNWQTALQRAVRDRGELLKMLSLPEFAGSSEGGGRQAVNKFPVFAPLEFVGRMKPGDPNDPLLLQVLATAAELEGENGFSGDPVGDKAAEVLPGLLQKYQGRALMILTGACAIHCRYCFRREFPYQEVPKSPRGWQAAIDHLATDNSIEEVILSGGDPLMVSDENLSWLIDELANLSHIKRLRIHSRMAVVIPQRITDELLQIFGKTRLATFFVTHMNHVQELDDRVREGLMKLKQIGVCLLNQAVLLRKVNDTIEAQKDLCSALVNIGVIPYYLHQLDRVRGAGHFETTVEQGRQIVDSLRAQLPGYAVPKYVAEIAGDASKRPL